MSGNLGDPLLNAWIVGWGAERLANGFAGVWDAPIFHPYENTLAYSEHLLGIATLVAPVYWVTKNAVLAYNIAFITAYALAAWGTYLLAKRLTLRSDVAFAVGLAFASSPYLTTSQSTRLQMLYCGWMAIGLWALHGYFDNRSRARLALFAVAYMMLGFSNMYLFVFFAIPCGLVMAYGVYLAKQRRRATLDLAVALTSIAAVMWPIADVYRQVQRNVLLERTVEENVQYSAAILSYASVWHESPLSRWLPDEIVADRALFPGFTLIVLALLNLSRLIGWSRRLTTSVTPASSQRSWFGVYVLTVLVAFALSLGPVPYAGAEALADSGPYAWLMYIVPGLDGLRAPARFGVIVILGIGALAAMGLSNSLAGRPRAVRAMVIAAVCLAAVAEGAVAPPRLVNFTGTLGPAEQHAFDWLDGEPPGAVLVLPIVPETFRHAPGLDMQTLVYQYRTLLHGRPMVNGSSGFKPPLVELLESEASPFLDPAHMGDVVRMARALDVRYVMIHEQDFRDPRHVRLLAEAMRRQVDQIRTERVFGSIRLFELRSNDAKLIDRQPAAEAMSSSRFQLIASDRVHEAENALDGDSESRWTSGQSQAGTEWLRVDFEAPIDVSHLRLSLGDGALGHYPRRLEIVSVTAEGQAHKLFDGNPIMSLALALVRRPADHVIDLAFGANRTGRLLIRQIGRAELHPWSVNELLVWER